MRNFIKSVLLFSLFCTCFYIIGLLFAPQQFKKNLKYKLGVSGHLISRLKEAKTTSNVDIVFLGSSMTYRGLDTRLFLSSGFKTFNLGSSAQTPIQTQVFIEKYLDRLNPKLVIYEVNPLLFSSDGVESSLDLISNDNITVETLKMALQVNSLTTYNTLVYSAIEQTLKPLSDFRVPLVTKKDRYVSGGYVEREITYNKSKGHVSQKWILKESQLKFFAENLKLLEEKKVKVILLFPPITKNLYESYVNHSEFDSTILKTGKPYLNFNEISQLNDSLDFYDEYHLNQNGVRKFNVHLLKILGNQFEKLVKSPREKV